MDNLNIEEAIYQAIRKIPTSRKCPHAENISKSVAKNLSLDKEQVTEHLESLVETGAVYITLTPKVEDSYFIFDFGKLGVSDSKESVMDCIESDSDKWNPKNQSLEWTIFWKGSTKHLSLITLLQGQTSQISLSY